MEQRWQSGREIEVKGGGTTRASKAIEKHSFGDAVSRDTIDNPFTGEKMKFERSPGNFSVRRIEGVTYICLYDDSARELRIPLAGPAAPPLDDAPRQ